MKITHVDKSPFHVLPYKSSGRKKTQDRTLPFYFAEAEGLPEDIDVIVATSDLQGRESDSSKNRLLGYAVIEEIEKLQQALIIPDINMLVLAGDLFDSPMLDKLGATGNVTELLNAFTDAFGVVIAAHGNHDIVSKTHLDKRLNVFDGNVSVIGGIRVGGVCGVIGKETKNQRQSPDAFARKLAGVIKLGCRLIVLHQTPWGGESKLGDKPSAEYLKHNGMGLVVAGHCHWGNDFLVDIGNNQVLNVDSKVVVIVKKSIHK